MGDDSQPLPWTDLLLERFLGEVSVGTSASATRTDVPHVPLAHTNLPTIAACALLAAGVASASVSNHSSEQSSLEERSNLTDTAVGEVATALKLLAQEESHQSSCRTTSRRSWATILMAEHSTISIPECD